MAFEITQNLEECIGCGACISVCEDWEMEDSKAIMKGMENNKKTINELGCNLEAAEICPVNCIHIKNLDTNEDLI